MGGRTGYERCRTKRARMTGFDFGGRSIVKRGEAEDGIEEVGDDVGGWHLLGNEGDVGGIYNWDEGRDMQDEDGGEEARGGEVGPHAPGDGRGVPWKKDEEDEEADEKYLERC